MGVPDRGCIFDQGANKGLVASGLDGMRAPSQVALDKGAGPVGLG